jgi:hypothetical protein
MRRTSFRSATQRIVARGVTTLGRVELHRQEVPDGASNRPPLPQRVPEVYPPLLDDWFIYLSVVVLFSGIIAITALEFGNPLTSAIVRVPALLGVALLVPISADAALRVWRSAWAWLAVDRGRGYFRFVWAAVLAGTLAASAIAVVWLISL